MNEDLQKRTCRVPVGRLHLGDGLLLFGGIFVMSFALIGCAGFVWDQIRPARGYALMLAMFFAPAFFAVGLKDLFTFGWSWKRAVAILLSLLAFGFVVLAFHEVISTTPLLRRN